MRFIANEAFIGE